MHTYECPIHGEFTSSLDVGSLPCPFPVEVESELESANLTVPCNENSGQVA